MHRRRNLSPLFASLLAVLALSAVTAGVAHAGEWRVKGQTFEELKVEKETIKGTGGEPFKLNDPALNFAYKCSSLSLTGSVIKKGTGEGTLKLTECSAVELKSGEPIASCTVAPITTEIKLELVEFEEVVYAKVTPLKGETFVKIKNEGAGCVLPKELALSGSTAGELEEKEQVKQPLTFSEKASTATGTQLKLGTNAASNEGKILVELTGAHAAAEYEGNVLITALCAESAGSCPMGQRWAKESAIESALVMGESAKLVLPGYGTITCTQSTFNNETKEWYAQPLPTVTTLWTFESCGACSVLESVGIGQAALRAVDATVNGKLSIGVRVKVKCAGPPLLECSYEQVNVILDIFGGANAKIEAKEEPISFKQKFGTVDCPAKVEWSGLYKVSAVAPLYVTR